MISWVRIRLKLYIYIIFLFSRILIKSSFCRFFFAYFPCFYLFKITTMHILLTSYIQILKRYTYTADISLYHPVILPRLQRNSCMFRAFFIILTLKKMFPNWGLNPNQTHRSKTPIPLRYLTGIELN